MSCWDGYVFPGAFRPILSLEVLHEQAEIGGGLLAYDLADSTPLPDEIVERDEAHWAVLRFVSALPARERDIVKRLFWHDQTPAEIAKHLGITPRAVNKALAKVRKRGAEVLAHLEINGPKN